MKQHQAIISVLCTTFCMGAIISAASAQQTDERRENEIWYFGKQAGISFAGGAPVPLTDGAMRSMETAATICDRSTGALLFYTNGTTVWDARHTIMPGGEHLLTHESSTQGAVIVPFPQDDSSYYIFTSSTPEGAVGQLGYYGLRYSVVDLRGNGGRGTVVRKDVPLLAGGSEKLTAVPHGSGSGYWVLTREWGTDKLHAFLVSCEGVSGPVTSHTGGVPYHRNADTSYSFRSTVGYLKASPDRTKLVSANAFVWDGKDFTYSTIELFDFDDRSGIISNRITLTREYGQFYGTSFSPDNSKLYAGGWVRGGGLIQFDLSNPDSAAIVSSMKRIELPSGSSVGALQIGPDGKIYVAIWDAPALGVLNRPNEPAPACNYQHDGFNLGGRISQRGLCNMMESPLNPTGGDTARFRISKTVSNSLPRYGDTVTYTISVCLLNACQPVEAIMTDALPEGLLYLDGMSSYPRHELGTMGGGECRSVTVRAVVTRGVPAGTEVVNCADVAAGNGVPIAVDRTKNCAAITVRETDIAIIKTNNRSEAYSGDRITYSVMAVNYGPADAANVVVQDLLPKEVRYISHTIDMTGTYDPATGNLAIPLLPAHSIATLRIECTLLPGGADIITNCARLVRLDAMDTDSSNNIACVETRRLCTTPELTVRAGIPRNLTTKLDGPVTVPVRLYDALAGRQVNRIGITVGYDSTVMTLLNGTMTGGMTRGTLLEGWNVTGVTDRRGRYRIELAAVNPEEYLLDSGVLLNLRFQVYLDPSLGSELPVTIDLPGNPCIAMNAAAGYMGIDSVCGLTDRMIELVRGEYALKGVRPNPAGSQATFDFSIGLDAHTTLEIIDGSGNRVALLADSHLPAGSHSIRWEIGDHPSGIYYYRLRSGDWSAGGSLVVVK